MSRFESHVHALSESIGAKNAKQWRLLLTLWTCTGIAAWLAPWNFAIAAFLFSSFVHLATTET